MRGHIIFAIIFAAILALESCDNDHVVKDAYRYEHVHNLAQQHAAILLELPAHSDLMQRQLMDLTSRAYTLEQQGDRQLSLYFRTVIEQCVQEADPVKARIIFGKPRSPFLR